MENVNTALTPLVTQTLGEVANQYANKRVFENYHRRMATETLRRHHADLALFTSYLQEVAGLHVDSEQLYENPASWNFVSYGLLEGFIEWMLKKGYAMGSINVRLSTVKKYCSLSFKAGELSTEENARIRLVVGFREKEKKHVDERREIKRIGTKKEHTVLINDEQCERLKHQPNTPQGSRDALLVCLLLDHGLRCSEIADLKRSNIDLEKGMLTFYRKKVDITQRNWLSEDAIDAAKRYFNFCNPQEHLLLGSRSNGNMVGRMSIRAITERMRYLCAKIGIQGASAHDGRHSWATAAAEAGTDIKTLQEAGGWNGLQMPAQYIAAREVANEKLKLNRKKSL